MQDHYEYDVAHDRRNAPYNNMPASNNTSIWLQFITIIGAMVLSWTTLNNTITRIDVNQINIKSDLEKLDTLFEKHNQVHLKSINDVKDQVNSLEQSVLNVYRSPIRRK